MQLDLLATSNTPHQECNNYGRGDLKTVYIIWFSEQESMCGNRSKPVLGTANQRKHVTVLRQQAAAQHVLLIWGTRFDKIWNCAD
jgi:hypothetical protein